MSARIAHFRRYTDRSMSVCGLVDRDSSQKIMLADNRGDIPPTHRMCKRCLRRLLGLRINARVP